jgi:hypothetical protein
MIIESFAFKHEGEIPSRFTCDGEGINPELLIKEVPPETKSLALILDDPDIPDFAKKSIGAEVFDHWVMWNISPDTTEINQGSEPADAVVGQNSAGKSEYAAPCPPDKEHRYFFRLYALDTMLSLSKNSTKKDLLEAMQGHILEETELMGRYERK